VGGRDKPGHDGGGGRTLPCFVMRGLVPRIHVVNTGLCSSKNVGGRDKPGHDGGAGRTLPCFVMRGPVPRIHVFHKALAPC